MKPNTFPSIEPRVYPRDQHPISRALISPNALRVLYRLHEAGFRSCLVGGGVRDLLLGREPKDFDVVTDAHPEDVRRLFRNCRLIGRRFRLAHVQFGREIIEVATFRASFRAEQEEGNLELSEDGRILRDNCYGTIEEDAWRRDFTINALYYDIANYSVLDYTHGVLDLYEGSLRLIGNDPPQRLREDPVRMLRAVRFSAKLGLRIAPEVTDSMLEHAGLLTGVAPARLFDEVLKLFHSGFAVTILDELERFHLFKVLFPATAASFARDEHPPRQRAVLVEVLRNTDARVQDDLPVMPAFLFAALLWAPFMEHLARQRERGLPEAEALAMAAHLVLSQMTQRIALPRRHALIIREIWDLQTRLAQVRTGARALRLVTHARFRAAFDFLCLRVRAGDADPALCAWWTHFQTTEAAQQALLARPVVPVDLEADEVSALPEGRGGHRAEEGSALPSLAPPRSGPSPRMRSRSRRRRPATVR